MNDLKRHLINRIQSNFPLTPTPFEDLARELNTTESEIITALTELKKEGILRRIGASIDSRKIGYFSTLVGCVVEHDKLDAVAAEICKNPNVTHAYERDDEINFWFTLISISIEKIERAIREYSRMPGVIKIFSLPADKVYKLKVQFDVSND